MSLLVLPETERADRCEVVINPHSIMPHQCRRLSALTCEVCQRQICLTHAASVPERLCYACFSPDQDDLAGVGEEEAPEP